MPSAHPILNRNYGASFLFEDATPSDVFSPEEFTEEHRAIAKAADEFYHAEVEPNLDRILSGELALAVDVLRKAAAAGLTSIPIPEKFGGLELDLASSLIAGEHLGVDGSYAAWHGAQTGIGTLPVLYFGTEEQKSRYLPKLARGELIAAYALTEAHAGSDALAARTRAHLSEDGKHYILNGQKMWITNGGAADLFTVFAKVGGKEFTAFLVERNFGGVTSGPEEKKMGIKGSSTTAIYFDNVPVPVDNVLGQVGRGHVIAFNILNIGRLNLGGIAVGGAKCVLAASLQYAKSRQAFGAPISTFGAIQHKLAEMAVRIFAAESIAWRVVGAIENSAGEARAAGSDPAKAMLKAAEEFAIECSLAKICGSEALDYVADEGVQIHGGYGFHQDYVVERAYRDSRINRIFEGTNEVNRLLVVGMLLKRAAKAQLPVVAAAQALMKDIAGGTIGAGDADEEVRLVRNARSTALLALWLAQQRFASGLEEQQEVLMNIADILLECYAMESVLLRSRKAVNSVSAFVRDICAVFLRDSTARLELAARNVLGACSPPEMIRMHMSVLRKLTVYDPIDTVELRRKIAGHLLALGRYAV